jgi:hypothetical protein
MTAFAAAVLALAAVQDASKKFDDFEGEIAGWAAIKVDDGSGPGADEESKLAVNRDGQHVKAGRGSLSYGYEISPTTVRVLTLQRPLDFTGMKSLRLWLKGTSATAFLISLNETGGAAYQATVYAPAGAWQEVVLNLDELTLDDPAKDANGKLDLDGIESFSIMDLGCFLVRFLGDVKGPRVLWLDDVGLSSEAAPRTTGVSKVAGAPVHLVDTFETPVVRWMPVSIEFADTPRFSIFEVPVATDAGAPPDGGKRSFKASYTRRAAKVNTFIRNLEKVDLKKATALELSLMTSRDGAYVVTIQEKDDSRYQKIVELKAGDGWKKLSHAFADFTKADDSQDENGKLDADQIKEIAVADFTTLAGGGEGENILRIDEARFKLSE